MVVISERSVEKLVRDVVPKVAMLTNWSYDLGELKIRIINRSQLWEHGFKPKYDYLGISTETKTDSGKQTLSMYKNIFSFFTAALYEPSCDTLFVVANNARFDTNESGLTVLLGHELVHRGQFTQNPQFTKQYFSLVKKQYGSLAFEEDEHEDKSFGKYLQSLMTIVEGDASFVESQLKKMYYQDASYKCAGIALWVSSAVLLASLANGDSKSGLLGKLSQYTAGEKIIKRVYEDSGRKLVNCIYKKDFQRIHDIVEAGNNGAISLLRDLTSRLGYGRR